MSGKNSVLDSVVPWCSGNFEPIIGKGIPLMKRLDIKLLYESGNARA
jgi:hypothetical protein